MFDLVKKMHIEYLMGEVIIITALACSVIWLRKIQRHEDLQKNAGNVIFPNIKTFGTCFSMVLKTRKIIFTAAFVLN